MTNLRAPYRVWITVALALLSALASPVVAAPAMADNSAMTGVQPSALLSIDQNRTTVIDRIVTQWGDALVQSGAGLTADQLRSVLTGLRADHLLAASVAGSLRGLRDVLASALPHSAAATSRLHINAIGDTSDDLVYTPVNPCRLFDSRPAQGGLGVMTPNVRRTYGATFPVASQGGPGSCNAPAGAGVAFIQIGTLTPAGNGYLQGGPQGIGTFPNALLLYQSGDQYGTAVAMPLNVANGQFDLQVQFAATDVYGDLLGYFQRPKNYGGAHIISGLYATDSGGFGNTASGSYGTVAGGYSNTSSGYESAVGGGANNTASGEASVVAGGSNNVGSGPHSAVGGGNFNIAANTSTVAGGELNVATGQLSAILGGEANQATQLYSAVVAGQSNAATGGSAFVGGGAFNTASGSLSTVAGGFNNVASGYRSIVVGGDSNVASGFRSYAAGSSAKTQTAGPSPVVHDGVFIWADAGGVYDFNSVIPNEFAVRATGGLRFVTAVDGTGLPAWTCSVSGGSGGSLGCSSDRNLKTGLISLDGVAILENLAALPVYRWFAKDDTQKTPHAGPMAQDFMAAFGLGDNDKMIGFADAQGVAFAAIQGLHQLVRQKDDEIATLRRRLQVIEEKLGLR
jgi:hypothetical protein